MIVHTCLVLKIVITNKPYKPSSWILPMLDPKNASSPVRWSVSPLWCRGDVSGVARYGQILRTNKHQNLSLLSCYHWFYAPKKFEVLTCSICFLKQVADLESTFVIGGGFWFSVASHCKLSELEHQVLSSWVHLCILSYCSSLGRHTSSEQKKNRYSWVEAGGELEGSVKKCH